MKSPTFEGKSCNTFPKIQPSRQPIENPSRFGKVLLEFLGFQQQIKMPPLNKMKNPQQNLNPTKLQSIYIENFDMKIPTTQPPNHPNGKGPKSPRHLLPSCHQWGTGELCSLRTVAGWSTTLVLPDDEPRAAVGSFGCVGRAEACWPFRYTVTTGVGLISLGVVVGFRVAKGSSLDFPHDLGCWECQPLETYNLFFLLREVERKVQCTMLRLPQFLCWC